MDNNAANSEKSQLIHEKSAKMYSLKLQRWEHVSYYYSCMKKIMLHPHKLPVWHKCYILHAIKNIEKYIYSCEVWRKWPIFLFNNILYMCVTSSRLRVVGAVVTVVHVKQAAALAGCFMWMNKFISMLDLFLDSLWQMAPGPVHWAMLKTHHLSLEEARSSSLCTARLYGDGKRQGD